MAEFNGKYVGFVCKTTTEMPSMFIMEDKNGTSVVASYVGEEPVFTATANDIREGTIAATDKGITKGIKNIPSYVTSEGYRIVPEGSEFKLPHLKNPDRYDFNKLMVVICPYDESFANSVAADKVVIDNYVYPVQSNEPISQVEIDHENKSINFGLINDSGSIYLMRYFTYKEIY